MRLEAFAPSRVVKASRCLSSFESFLRQDEEESCLPPWLESSLIASALQVVPRRSTAPRLGGSSFYPTRRTVLGWPPRLVALTTVRDGPAGLPSGVLPLPCSQAVALAWSLRLIAWASVPSLFLARVGAAWAGVHHEWSSGGSSWLFCCFGLGVLASGSRDDPQQAEEDFYRDTISPCSLLLGLVLAA